MLDTIGFVYSAKSYPQQAFDKKYARMTGLTITCVGSLYEIVVFQIQFINAHLFWMGYNKYLVHELAKQCNPDSFFGIREI